MTKVTKNVSLLPRVRSGTGFNSFLLVRVYVRCFMKAETTPAYTEMFTVMFGLINKVSVNSGGGRLYFQCIHGHGIRTITADMDTKQAAGTKQLQPFSEMF